MKKSGRTKDSNRYRSDTLAIRDMGGPKDPNLDQLKEEFLYTLNERDSSVFSRATLNHDTRYCVWPGQSADGRKWMPALGQDEVFPWAGASDARVNLVDLYVRKHVAFLMTLWTKMRTIAHGTESNDDAWAARLTTLLRWLKYTQMTEARAEHELLANYLLERGNAIMGVFWSKQSQLQYQELDLETLVQLCYQKMTGQADPMDPMRAPGGGPPEEEGGGPAAQKFADLPEMALDPSHDAESAELMTALFPGTASKRLEQVLQDLRTTGNARFPRPVVTQNRPLVRAYCPNDDIFVSPDAYRMEDGSVFQVEVCREAKFRGYAKDNEWDEAWTAEVLESQKGNVEFGGLLFNQRMNRNASWLVPSRGQLDVRKLYLVVHAYRRLADAEGVPGIYYTVFHPHLLKSYAKHELLNYDHGQMPYVLFQQERRSRKIDDARGYGEIANTWQGQIKAEWDNRIDRSSINTLPPSFYPTGQQPDKWGPGVQVPTTTPDRYGFFKVEGDPMGSKEVEESVRHYADEYFGFAQDPENMVDSMAMRQKLADDWMSGETKVDTQCLQLCQQFMPDEFYFRVVGSSKGKPIHCTREEIQGEFDVQTTFAAEDLDPKVKAEKLELLQIALGMDAGGIVDHNEALVAVFEMIDPNLGERLLKPAEAASQAEVEDELNAALKLLKGIPVPIKPGQAYQLRLQVLQNLLQSNAAAQRDLQSNPQAQEVTKQHVQELQLAYQNTPGMGPNAMIGRGGVNFKPKAAKGR